MLTEKRKMGNTGEDIAVEYLLAKGYSLLDWNVQASHHEVDIVMLDGNSLVFVEVKTRKSDFFIDPIRAVDDEKLWNLLEASNIYRKAHPEYYRLDFRIDVVCVVGDVREESNQVVMEKYMPNPHYRIDYYVNPFERRIMEHKPWKTHYRNQRKTHFGYYRVWKR